MGNIQAFFGRGEKNNSGPGFLRKATPTGLPTADSDNDLFRIVDGRPCFMVDDVACYTRNQLVLELHKKERRRIEVEMNTIYSQTDATQPSSSGQDPPSTDLVNEIEMSRADCERMHEIAKKLEEMKMELASMEEKRRNLGNKEEHPMWTDYVEDRQTACRRPHSAPY